MFANNMESILWTRVGETGTQACPYITLHPMSELYGHKLKFSALAFWILDEKINFWKDFNLDLFRPTVGGSHFNVPLSITYKEDFW